MHAFLLDFGDFSSDQYSPIEQCIFILSAITVPLILLNMLIAIMSDTFERVKEQQSKRDFQEMIGLVYRYETIAIHICCRKKKANPWKYIYYSTEARKEDDATVDLWQGRIKGIKNELERMQKKHAATDKKIEEWQKQNENYFKNIEEQINSNEAKFKKIEEWQQNSEQLRRMELNL